MFLIYSTDILAAFKNWPPKFPTDLHLSLYMENYLRKKNGLFTWYLSKSNSLSLNSRSSQCQNILNIVGKSNREILAAVNA